MGTDTPDPLDRYRTATAEVERLQARIIGLGEERAAALTELREKQGLGLRRLADLTGLSVARVQVLTKGADTSRSSANVGRPHKNP